MFERKLMAVGQWDLALDLPPETVKRLSARAYARLIVTTVQVGDPNEMAIADLLAVACYSGVMYGRSAARTGLRGYGLAVLLGGPNGLGNSFGSGFKVAALPKYDGSNDSWIRKYVLRVSAGGANGITVGDIASAASPTHKGNVAVGQSQLSLLGWVCRVFTTSTANPQEWEITTAGKLNQRQRYTLWPTTDPSADPSTLAMASPLGGGREPGQIGLTSVAFDERDDWDDYSTEFVESGPTETIYGTPYTFSGSDSITSPYVDLAGDPIVMRRVETGNNADSNADCDTIAAQRLPRWTRPQREITLTTDLHHMAGVVDVGDTINVFSPDHDLYDRTRQVEFEGRPMFPTTTRVVGSREPIRADMGVYLRSWNGSAFEITDLSPWVVPDDGPVTLECGEPRRRRAPSAVAVA